ncbi:hypothetical protein N499_0405B, partial [Wolbachia pipientis wVitA]
SVS